MTLSRAGSVLNVVRNRHFPLFAVVVTVQTIPISLLCTV